MRYFLFLFLLTSLSLSAQPTGQLFVHSQQGDSLGYIDFPSGQYHFIDTTTASDILVHGDRLYVARGYDYFQEGNVLVYDLATLQRIDTIVGARAKALAFWEDMLVVASVDSPLLRVYDAANGYQPVFDLMGYKYEFEFSRDIMVSNGIAYLLTLRQFAAIDLTLQDTLAVTEVGEFHIAGEHLVDKGDHVYIEIELLTAVPRRALSRVHKDTLRQVEELYTWELIWDTYPPVLAGDSLYLFHYPSYYDFSQDSLFIPPMPMFIARDTFPIAYDEASNSMILYNRATGRFQYLQNGVWSAPTDSMGGWLNVSYYHTPTATDLEDELFQAAISIYPNPTKHEFFVSALPSVHLQKIQLLDITGRTLLTKKVKKSASETRISLEGLASGTYFLRILSEDKWFRAKVVKQ